MDVSPQTGSPDSLANELKELINTLPNTEKGSWIQQAVQILLRLAKEDIDTADWKIIARTLQDLEKGFNVFQPYRHTRKVTVFGSARIASDTEEYALAKEFSQCLAQQGFMVMTGAGGGLWKPAMKVLGVAIPLA